MLYYKDFIPENVAFNGAKSIGVYNSNGTRIAQIPLGNLALKNTGKLLYKVGGVSDIHLSYDTALADFRMAKNYLFDVEKVQFTFVAGDLTSGGTESQFASVKSEMNGHDFEFCLGNHDIRGGLVDNIEEHTGKPLYYTREEGNDLYIFFGCRVEAEGRLFTTEMLQWLYEVLEENRNRRTFLVHHVRPQDGCGNAYGIYNYDIWGGTEATVFESLMSHYKNVHQFHGHSHLKFYLQYGSDIANIDKIFGGYSIHIPSLAVPRDGDVTGANSRQEIYADSEGYVVDVYENGIHLRGRDFVKEEFLPIASYWLDTTLVEIPAGTYTDSTGTITV